MTRSAKARSGIAAGLLLAAAVTFVDAGAASARMPRWGGLGGVAASPDGKTVVTGGDNRVLYVLDGATLEVKQRLHFKHRICGLAWSKDGTRIIVEAEDSFAGALIVLDAATFKPVGATIKGEFLSFNPEAGLGVVFGGTYQKPEAIVFSAADASVKATVALPVRGSGAAVDPTGTKLYVVTQDADDATEKKVPYNEIPKDLKDLARDEFVQKNDGRSCRLLTFELPSGKPAGDAKLFFSAGLDPAIIAEGGAVTVLTFNNVNARLAGDKITLFRKKGGGYAHAVSGDHKTFAAGGMVGSGFGEGSVGTPGEAVKELEFKFPDKLPGFPEYYTGFSFTADGTVFGSTTAYRIIKVSKSGAVEKAVSVY